MEKQGHEAGILARMAIGDLFGTMLDALDDTIDPSVFDLRIQEYCKKLIRLGMCPNGLEDIATLFLRYCNHCKVEHGFNQKTLFDIDGNKIASMPDRTSAGH